MIVVAVPDIGLAKAAKQVRRRVTADLPGAVASLRRVVVEARLWPRIIAGDPDHASAEAILGACSHAISADFKCVRRSIRCDIAADIVADQEDLQALGRVTVARRAEVHASGERPGELA